MPVYSYYLSGLPEREPLEFDLESDASAVALSICVLRDEPAARVVWVFDGEEPVALRLRGPAEAGSAVLLR